MIKGDFSSSQESVERAKKELVKTMNEEKVKGFADVLVAQEIIQGLSNLYVKSNF